MTTFTQNFTITAAVPSPNPQVIVDLNTPLMGTGVIAGQPIVASPYVFGVAAGSNWDGFATLNTAGYRAALTAVGPLKFWRLNPNIYTFPNAGLDTNTPASIVDIDPYINMQIAMGYTGRTCCGLGGNVPFGNNEYGKMANLAMQIAKYAISKGMPFTHWEGKNEPSSTGTSETDVWGLTAAVADVFANAGAPFNTYVVTGPTTNNTPTNVGATVYSSWVSGMGNRNYGLNFHFYGATDFGSFQGNTASQIALTIDSSHGYGAITRQVKGYKAGAPVIIGEYNMAGYDETNDENQNNWGAVYAALATMDGIKGGNVEMMAIWDAVQTEPQGTPFNDVYGIINGDNTRGTTQTTIRSGVGGAPSGITVPPWAPFPQAWVLGRLTNYMPGPVVTTTHDTALQNKIYSMATKDPVTGAFKCLCLVNYEDTGVNTTVNVRISTPPPNLTLFEISHDDPAPPYSTTTPVKRAITSGNLSNIVLKPGSVVIISTAP